MHPIAALAQLAGSLGIAEAKDRKNRNLGVVERKHLGRYLTVLPRSRTGRFHAPCQAALAKAQHRRIDISLAEIHDRFTTRLLIARRSQRVGAERVLVGGGSLFFDQRTQHPDLLRGEVEFHPPRLCRCRDSRSTSPWHGTPRIVRCGLESAW